jgi:hypothetical protein
MTAVEHFTNIPSYHEGDKVRFTFACDCRDRYEVNQIINVMVAMGCEMRSVRVEKKA